MTNAIVFGEVMGLWIVVLAGFAGCVIGLYFLYMYLFDLVARWFRFHSLFREFIWSHYNKRPASVIMSEEDVEKLKQEFTKGDSE